MRRRPPRVALTELELLSDLRPCPAAHARRDDRRVPFTLRHRWGLRWYDAGGTRRRKSPFPSKSAALAYYRAVIEPQLRGDPAPSPELTLGELAELYLERHAASVRPRTILELRKRLRYATEAFGSVPLSDLERMAGEIASWRSRLPERSRYGVTQALRQTLEAACRWGYMGRNPAKLAGSNPQPSPRTVRAFTAEEIEAIAAELPPTYAPLPAFAAATGLRPEEWGALERRDVDRHGCVLTVRQTISSGEVVELGKTRRSRRQVSLSSRALGALDELPPDSIRRTFSPPSAAAPSTSPTSGVGSGDPHLRRRASVRRPGFTTCARRSPRTRWPRACLSSSWPG